MFGVLSILCAAAIAVIGLRATRRDTSPTAKLRRELDADPVQRSLMDASPELSGYRVRSIEDSAEAARVANWWMAALGLASAVFGLAALLIDR